jgi:hypothetical protein
MIYSRTPLFVLIVSILLLSPGYAQAQRDNATADDETAALREKAYKVLESIATQLNTLQSVENRARMGSNLVDSLWTHDKQRALALLRMVQEDIKNELQKRDLPRHENERFSVFLRLRQDTVARVAKHDAEAALEFLTVTEPVFAERKEGYEQYEFRTKEYAMRMRLAQQIAADNPDIALKLGREALDQEFSMELLTLLSRLNRKHKPQAQLFHKEIVEKLRDAEIERDWNARYIVQVLVQSFRPPDSDVSTYQQLIDILVTKALENGCAKQPSVQNEGLEFCRWVATNVGLVEAYDSRIGKIKQWEIEGYRTDRSGFIFGELEQVLDEGDVDQIQAYAAKSGEFQVSVYTRAIQHALNNGDPAKARKLIERFPADPQRRAQLVAMVDGYERRFAVNEAKLADIQKRLQELTDVRARTYFLLEQADVLGVTDRNVALKLLNQASEMIESMAPGKDQTLIRIILALLYATHKSDRGFAIMESVVPKLNELVDVAVRLDGYDTNYLRDGEWNMSANGATGEILTRLSERAGSFAWCDFDRAVSLASQFERPEIRMMAHLKLAQSILAEPPKRLGRY